MYILSPKFQNAMYFASIKHVEQVRKGTQNPYIIHPISVAQIIFEITSKNTPESLQEEILDVMCAGVLHDVLEDTNATEDEIVDKFGIKVLDYIKDASENDKSLPWKERKTETISKLITLSHLALLVPLADKIHNLSEMNRDLQTLDDLGKKKYWDKFNAGFEEQKWYYQSILDAVKENKNNNNEYVSSFLKKLMHKYQALLLRIFDGC